jgi:hypothetical protein
MYRDKNSPRIQEDRFDAEDWPGGWMSRLMRSRSIDRAKTRAIASRRATPPWLPVITYTTFTL